MRVRGGGGGGVKPLLEHWRKLCCTGMSGPVDINQLPEKWSDFDIYRFSMEGLPLCIHNQINGKLSALLAEFLKTSELCILMPNYSLNIPKRKKKTLLTLPHAVLSASLVPFSLLSLFSLSFSGWCLQFKAYTAHGQGLNLPSMQQRRPWGEIWLRCSKPGWKRGLIESSKWDYFTFCTTPTRLTWG